MGRHKRRSHAHSYTTTLYSGLGVTCENHGSTLVMRSKDLRTSKNKILKALLCLCRYYHYYYYYDDDDYYYYYYSRYVLSKLSWYFTIANRTKPWITEHLDSVVNGYIRKWLDIPISGTLSNVFLERNKFGLNICPPSINFTQCQTVLRNSLKDSPNDSLKDLWKSSSCHTNIQYDVYKSTKEVLKDFRSNQEDKVQHHLTSQGFFFSNVIKYSLSSVNSIWSEAQSHLPKNIYSFTIRYINNSLPTRMNMARWGLSQSPDFSFCLDPESLLHVVAGCQQYLDRFTWRHDSVLNFIAKSLQPVINVHSSLYADVNGFLNPSIITGENYRPDLLILIQSKCLYVLELTVGFESNLNNNAVRKKEKYQNLINEVIYIYIYIYIYV